MPPGRLIQRGASRVTTTETGSTIPRRQLGRYLRQLREDAGITIKIAAESLEWSPVKIWRIETGQTAMRSLDVANMCTVYHAEQELSQELCALAKETKSRGWWHTYGDAIPEWFELYIGLEAAASRLRQYQPELIPGLLQTAGYARRVFNIANPDALPADIDRAIKVRLGRQAILTRRFPPAPRLEATLHESCLRRSFGEPGEVVEQLTKINQVSRLPNVSIRVLPMSAGVHRAAIAGGNFVILDFAPRGAEAEPAIVYSEGLTGALYLEKPKEVAAFDDMWRSMQQVCLDEASSRDLIAALLKERHDD